MPLTRQNLTAGKALPGNNSSASINAKKIEMTIIDAGSIRTCIGVGRLNNFSNIPF